MSHELNSSKLNKTDIHEFYFKLYMQLNLFLKRRKRELWKNLSNFFYLRTVPLKHSKFRALTDLRTVPFKNGTFRAYHPMKSA